MKYLLVIILFICTATLGAHAAKTGIGVSVQGDGGTIYIPIEVSKHFRLEPTLFFSHSENEYEEGDKSSYTTMQFDLGLFGKSEIYEQLNTYYGARIGYIYSQQDRSSSFFSDYDSETHGVNIAPTLGIEYFFSERFSVGGEVAWYFRYSEDNSSSSGPVLPEESISTGTDSRLIARFYF